MVQTKPFGARTSVLAKATRPGAQRGSIPSELVKRAKSCCAPAKGFTLIEVLIVISIIILLLSLVVPTLKSVRGQMKSLMCTSKLKTIAFKFNMFAQGVNRGGRGKSDNLGKQYFWIDDFQASLYGTGDFWESAGTERVVLKAGKDLMVCPAGPSPLMKFHGEPFGEKAIMPAENVSFGLNNRLHQAVTLNHSGEEELASVEATRVSVKVLNHPYVPLILDVDGNAAKSKDVPPFYIAPPGRNANDPYSDERHWIPSKRHAGRVNVSFVGGHVLTSRNPSRESWDWEYQAEVRR